MAGRSNSTRSRSRSSSSGSRSRSKSLASTGRNRASKPNGSGRRGRPACKGRGRGRGYARGSRGRAAAAGLPRRRLSYVSWSPPARTASRSRKKQRTQSSNRKRSPCSKVEFKLNVNTCTPKELMEQLEISEKVACTIVKYRKRKGEPLTLDDVKRMDLDKMAYGTFKKLQDDLDWSSNEMEPMDDVGEQMNSDKNDDEDNGKKKDAEEEESNNSSPSDAADAALLNPPPIRGRPSRSLASLDADNSPRSLQQNNEQHQQPSTSRDSQIITPAGYKQPSSLPNHTEPEPNKMQQEDHFSNVGSSNKANKTDEYLQSVQHAEPADLDPKKSLPQATPPSMSQSPRLQQLQTPSPASRPIDDAYDKAAFKSHQSSQPHEPGSFDTLTARAPPCICVCQPSQSSSRSRSEVSASPQSQQPSASNASNNAPISLSIQPVSYVNAQSSACSLASAPVSASPVFNSPGPYNFTGRICPCQSTSQVGCPHARVPVSGTFFLDWPQEESWWSRVFTL